MTNRIEKLLEQIQVNEQIQRLAEQAGCTIDRLGYGEGNLEKFAELIVDQCFKVALVEGKGYLNPIKLRDAMKKHFGVEE